MIELVYQTFFEFSISPKKNVAYCKVPKIGTNTWGSFFARAGKSVVPYFDTFLRLSCVVLGGSQKFEKKFKVQLGNKTLDEVRKEYGINGMNSIREVMPTIENYTGFLN